MNTGINNLFGSEGKSKIPFGGVFFVMTKIGTRQNTTAKNLKLVIKNPLSTIRLTRDKAEVADESGGRRNLGGINLDAAPFENIANAYPQRITTILITIDITFGAFAKPSLPNNPLSIFSSFESRTLKGSGSWTLLNSEVILDE
jgi:hypothetical protein